MGRSVRTSFVILDAQSVKNTVTPENKGYDGGKKINGIKRHITTANVSEHDGAVALLALNDEQFELVQRVMADGGYTGDDFAQSVHAIIGADVIIIKRSDLKNGQVTPQRWVVERSFNWLTNWRRLWFNCERKLNTSKVMVFMAFIGILIARQKRPQTVSKMFTLLILMMVNSDNIHFSANNCASANKLGKAVYSGGLEPILYNSEIV